MLAVAVRGGGGLTACFGWGATGCQSSSAWPSAHVLGLHCTKAVELSYRGLGFGPCNPAALCSVATKPKKKLYLCKYVQANSDEAWR